MELKLLLHERQSEMPLPTIFTFKRRASEILFVGYRCCPINVKNIFAREYVYAL